MYIKHKGKEFDIYPNEAERSIRIKAKKNDIYILSVPHSLPNSELLEYLNIYGQSLIKKFESKQGKEAITYLELYNKKFAVIVNKDASRCYRKENIIYSTYSTKSKQNRKRVCNEVFTYDIRTLIGIWEERLICIVENVNIKSFKTKPFKICHLSNSIDFSLKLIHYDFSYVQFIIAKSVFSLLKLDQITQDRLMNEFVSDYKHNTKIFEYEGGY